MLEKMVEDEVGKGGRKEDRVFWAYARPCADDLKTIGSINDSDYKKVKSYQPGEVPERKFLEHAYPEALRRIKETARKLGFNDYWDSRVIRHYFLFDHNIAIDNEDGKYKGANENIKELCKVRAGEVVGKLSGIYEVKYKLITEDLGMPPREKNELAKWLSKAKDKDGKDRVLGVYLSDRAKVGDIITTHWKFACEVITDENHSFGK
jgi:hypothetical protein